MSIHPSLTEKQMATVKSTIPLLESAGTAITDHFYKRLFLHHPELQNIFNMSNQASGRQQFALFSAVASYAKHIDNVSALLSAVERIANKHASMNIKAEHYPIVGEHLIETLRELAGEAFTPEVEEAWTAAYAVLSDIFIKTEETIYQKNNDKTGGWRGERKFVLTKKVKESELVTSFTFKPKDNKDIATYKPGQYIGIKLVIPGREHEEIRQYSLSKKPDNASYRISVKREGMQTPGIVSHFLHDELAVGQEVSLFAPTGDFFFQDRQAPVVLISAGVGLTPMQAILESLENSDQEVHYLHACESSEQHSFKNRVKELTSRMHLSHHTWYRNTLETHVETNAESNKNEHKGFMDVSLIKESLPLHNGDFYLCGPVVFMQFIKQQLINLGITENKIHYEVFGPHQAF